MYFVLRDTLYRHTSLHYTYTQTHPHIQYTQIFVYIHLYISGYMAVLEAAQHSQISVCVLRGLVPFSL